MLVAPKTALKRLVVGGVVGFLCLTNGAHLTAQSPCVHFDVPEVVTVRTRTDQTFQEDHPGEILVEATFKVSSLIRIGREEDIRQYLYVIESPERTLKVVDYSPKTEMVTELAGNVGIQKHSETSANIGLNGSIAPSAIASAQGNLAAGNKAGTQIRYEMLPPKHLLSASGTIARSTAVYYKLRPSGQTSLDGSRSFTVVYRVSEAWRGDYVRLRCVAYAESGRHAERPICGSSDFLVGVHLAGDDAARDTVTQLTQADRSLRQLSQSHQAAIERQRFPTMTDKLGAILNVARPKIPEDWLGRVMRHTQPEVFERNLPSAVRRAVGEFREAREAVRKLSRPSVDLVLATS